MASCPHQLFPQGSLYQLNTASSSCHVFSSDQLLIRPCIHLESTYRKKNINCLLNAKMSGQCTRLDNRVGFCEAMKPVCFHHDHHWHEGEGAVEERQSVCLRRGSQRVLESFSRAAQMSCDVSCATSQSSSLLSRQLE